MARADADLLRDALFSLAEIAGNGQGARAADLKQRCGLSGAALRKAVGLLIRLGLIERAPGRAAAYRTVGGAHEMTVGAVLELLRNETCGGNGTPRGRATELEGLAAQLTIGRVGKALRAVQPCMCPYTDLCNALRGLDYECDPFGEDCPAGSPAGAKDRPAGRKGR